MELLLVRHAEPVRIGPEESGGRPGDPPRPPLGGAQAARRGAGLAPADTSLSRVRASRTGARSLASLNETAHLFATREPAA